MWQLQWGGQYEFLLKVEKDTGATPSALLNRITPFQHTVQYWEAFHTLSGSRRFTSVGPAAIPLSELLAFFNIFEIHNVEEREEYVHHIRLMDQIYLEHFNKKVKT